MTCRQKKTGHKNLFILKIVQCFKHFQSCNSNKDQNKFYKAVDGSPMNRTEHTTLPKSQFHNISDSPSHSAMKLKCTLLSHNSSLILSMNCLTYKPCHLTFQTKCDGKICNVQDTLHYYFIRHEYSHIFSIFNYIPFTEHLNCCNCLGKFKPKR